MSSHPREYTALGKYVDNRVHVIGRNKLDNIFAPGTREGVSPSGILIHVRVRETGASLSVDLHDINCQGIGTPIFRLRGTDLCYSRPFTVERRWSLDNCVWQCGHKCHNLRQQPCVDANGDHYWTGEPTLQNYPRQDKRTRYARRPAAAAPTTQSAATMSTQPAATTTTQPANVQPQLVHFSAGQHSTAPPTVTSRKRSADDGVADGEGRAAALRPRLTYWHGSRIEITEQHYPTDALVYNFGDGALDGSQTILDGTQSGVDVDDGANSLGAESQLLPLDRVPTAEADMSSVRLGKRKACGNNDDDDDVEEDVRARKAARTSEDNEKVEVPDDFDLQNVDFTTASPEMLIICYAYMFGLDSWNDTEVDHASQAEHTDASPSSPDVTPSGSVLSTTTAVGAVVSSSSANPTSNDGLYSPPGFTDKGSSAHPEREDSSSLFSQEGFPDEIWDFRFF